MEKLISIGQILDDSLDLYKKNFLKFLKISLWLLLPAIITLVGAQFGLNFTSGVDINGFVPPLMVVAITLKTIGAILAVLISLWVSIVLILSINNSYHKNNSKIKTLEKKSLHFLLRYILASILIFLILSISAIFFIPSLALYLLSIYAGLSGTWFYSIALILFVLGLVGALIYVAKYSIELLFVPYAIVADNKGPISSIHQSISLVKGRFFKVFFRVIFIKIIIFIFTITVGYFAFKSADLFSGLVTRDLFIALRVNSGLRNIIQPLITALSLPLMLIADFLVYESLKKTSSQPKK